ncbi:MAG: hypothetical protein WC661_21310 [Opitutaceae bacterium]|jgi:hypothetical protein
MKRRSDSKLKTLPDPVQDQLYAIYERQGGEEALAWLEEKHGVKSNTGSLSKFAAWFPFSRPLEMVARHASQFKAAAKANPKIKDDAEQAAEYTQIAFEQLALQQQNLKGFVSLQKVRLKKVDQRHDARRISLLEKKAAQLDEAEGVMKDETLNEAEKAQRMRSLFGMG